MGVSFGKTPTTPRLTSKGLYVQLLTVLIDTILPPTL